ncbi:MAG: hypothetical protein U0326_13735 [Polyangiales bacterium]
MRGVTLVAALISLGASACSQEQLGDAPVPVTPVAERDRCRGLDSHLALLRVEGDPVPFREVPQGFPPEEPWVGIDVTVSVEQVLPATFVPSYVTPRAAPTGTFRVHYYTDIDRSVRTGNFTPIDVSRLVRGGRVLAEFPVVQVGAIVWPFHTVATTPDGARLAARWYQFPAGTASTQVLDAAEWNDPSRACFEGPQPPGDAGRTDR